MEPFAPVWAAFDEQVYGKVQGKEIVHHLHASNGVNMSPGYQLMVPLHLL